MGCTQKRGVSLTTRGARHPIVEKEAFIESANIAESRHPYLNFLHPDAQPRRRPGPNPWRVRVDPAHPHRGRRRGSETVVDRYPDSAHSMQSYDSLFWERVTSKKIPVTEAMLTRALARTTGLAARRWLSAGGRELQTSLRPIFAELERKGSLRRQTQTRGCALVITSENKQPSNRCGY